MQKLFFFLLILTINNICTAQQKNPGTITGKIVDSVSATGIDYATVSLFLNNSKKPVTGTTTDVKGNFTLTDVAEGNYHIVIESIGYQPFTLSNISIIKNAPGLALKSVMLIKNQAMMQGVVVTAPAGLITNKIDKMIFNAEKDLTSQGGVATDVLKKVPQVSVDVDGNVELAGNSGIRFLINGKPSSAFGSNIADVLQSIPASQIKSIEVITNPGAKYDAQGLGGIINIILKQSKVKGINGNLSLSAGTRNENGSFNLNAKKDNFAVNAFISGNQRLKSTTPSSSARQTADTADHINSLLTQQGNSRFERHGYQTGAGFDWTFKKKNSISGSFSYNDFGFSGNGFNNQLLSKTDAVSGDLLSSISLVNNTTNQFKFTNNDVSLNYKRTFDKEDQELEIAVNSSFGKNHTTVSNFQLLQPMDSLSYGNNSNNPGKENETEIKVDYTQPLNKNIILGSGGKIVLTDINSNANVFSFQPGLKDYFYDNSLSNNLSYNQKVYALYSELSFPVAKLFDAKIGGRYERTQINSFYSNAQQQVIQPGYNTFVPSIYVSRKLNDNETVKLSYSKRIERPGYEELNPFVNTTDPKNISAGNPFLKPEIGHRIELSYNRNLDKIGSFMITAFYRINQNDIQPYIVYYPSFKAGDSVYTNVAVSTRQNIGSERNAGVNLFADLHATTKLTIRSNVFMFYRHTINALQAGNNPSSFNYRFNMNAAYQFTTSLAGEFFGNFNSARNEVQGKYPSFTSYSIALRKQLWNKKGSIALLTTNPFKKYVDQRTRLFGPNFTTNSLRQVPFQALSINFTWKFGKLEFKKDKEDDKGNSNTPTE